MTRLLAGALFALVTLTSCTPSTFRADVGAVLATTSGEVALQNAGGTLVLDNTRNDIDDVFGLGEAEGSPYVRLEWEHALHRVRAHGFGIETEGSGTLINDYGGLVAGSNVTTKMRFFTTSASYAFEVWGNENFRLGLGGQLAYYSLDMSARSAIGFESLVTDVLVPMPFVEFETYFSDFTLGVNGGVMVANLGDGEVTCADLEAYTRYQLTNEIDLLAGYRYMMIDGEGVAEDRDFQADMAVQGWFVGGGLRF
jgi:hypothetical protein